MKSKAFYLISTIGAVVALTSFFLPWVKVGFVVGHKTLTGIGLADKDVRLWIIPLCASAALFASFLLIKKHEILYRVLTAISGTIGLFVTAFTFIAIKKELSKFFIQLITNYHIQAGILFLFVGFLLVLIPCLIQVDKLDTESDTEI